MALNDQTTFVEYIHNGVVTDYTISYMYFDTDDIKVYSIDGLDNYTEIFEGTDFTFQTVSGGVEIATGVKLPDTIRLNTAGEVPTGDTIRLQRTTAATQENTVADKTVEVSLDKLTAEIQEIKVDVQSSSSLKPLIDQNTSDITDLDGRVTTNENDIVAAEFNIDSNTSDIAQLDLLKADKTTVTALDLRVGQNESDISDNAALASAAMAKANNNEADIALINLDTAQITTNKNDIAALDLRVGQNETDITTNTASLVNHEGRIQALESDLLDAVINGTMDIVNNVTVPADVTYEDPAVVGQRRPLEFDADETVSVEIKFAIERSDATTDQPASGTLYMIYRAPDWHIDYGYLYGWNPDIDFSVVTDPVTKVGTVKYISSDFTGGSYSSTIRFSAKSIGRGV